MDFARLIGCSPGTVYTLWRPPCGQRKQRHNPAVRRNLAILELAVRRKVKLKQLCRQHVAASTPAGFLLLMADLAFATGEMDGREC